MELVKVTSYGQIDTGDVLLIRRRSEFVSPVTVKEILNQGTDKEEIILSKGSNVYFITSIS